MIAFDVHDMTCGHCAGTINKALKATDPGARVSIDLARRRVTVERASASADELRDAIAEAGYTPIAVESTPPGSRAPTGGACCNQCL